ncbi:M16 family metallopeptidase [Salinibius halmophilus]|uniref:M16 family metallopeptidase n=1 Tax=Salinibius halmophilus TaxID=1853216 RepID=UPI001314F9E8|nr:insulinase family protein [Salinibius halmophilus]
MLKLLAAAVAAAPMLAAAQSPLQADERVVVGELDNGLDYYILPLPASEARPTVEMRLYVNAGSLDETDEQLGYAHILEHMAFNGSENYSENDVVRFFERAGMQFGGDINAYTTFGETVYQLSIPSDDRELVSEAYQVLGDWAYRLDISPEEVEKEIGVVLEEWQMRGTDDSVEAQWLEANLEGTSWGNRLPIGTEESIKGVTAEGLRDYYQTHYQPDRMAVLVIGDVYPEQAVARITEEFGDFKDVSNVAPALPSDSLATQGRPWFKFSDQNVSSTSIEFGRISPEPSYADLQAEYEASLTAFVLTNAVNTRFAEITNASGSPVSSLGFGSGPYLDGFISDSLSAQVKQGRLAEAAVLLERERMRLLTFGLTQAEIDNSLAEVTAMYENYMNMLANAPANSFVEGLLSAARDERTLVPSIESELAVLQQLAISEADAKAFLTNSLADGGYTLFHPKGEHAEVNADQYSRWLTQARSEAVEPFAVQAGSAVAGMAFPGDILGAEELALENGYKLMLANGQEAWLLQTDIENNKVQLQLQLAEGRLQLPDNVIPAVDMLPYLISQQPRLGFSATQLDSETTKRQVDWGLDIGSYSGYAYVEFPVEEAAFATELLLDIIYNPLPNTERLADDIATYQQDFAGFAATADGQYRRTYSQAMWGETNHAWANFELVNADTLAQAAQLLASDANLWALVGDIDVESGAQLLANYVAGAPVVSFPALAARELATPFGTEQVVNGSTEEGAVTELFRAVPFDIDTVVADLAVNIVDKRIIEDVRESQSLIYSAWSYYFQETNEVFGQDLGAIGWTSDPGRTQVVRDAINNSIAGLLAEGVSEEQLATAKSQLINANKDYFASLNGKMALLTNAFDNKQAPLSQAQMTAEVEAVTIEEVETYIEALFQGPAYQLTFQP